MNISDGRWRGCRRVRSPTGDAPPDLFSISIPGPRRLNSLPRTAGGLGAPTMIPVPGRFVSLTRRTIPVGVVTALLAVAVLSFLMPSPAAAPVAPPFGPNVQIHVPRGRSREPAPRPCRMDGHPEPDPGTGHLLRELDGRRAKLQSVRPRER